jgi:hypothetical protein
MVVSGLNSEESKVADTFDTPTQTQQPPCPSLERHIQGGGGLKYIVYNYNALKDCSIKYGEPPAMLARYAADISR